jgi:hypothetical protein
VKTSKRIDDFGSHVTFPEEWLKEADNTVGMPSVFVLNAQIPSNFSLNFFSDVSNGEGWSLVMYYKLTKVSFLFSLLVLSYSLFPLFVDVLGGYRTFKS